MAYKFDKYLFGIGYNGVSIAKYICHKTDTVKLVVEHQHCGKTKKARHIILTDKEYTQWFDWVIKKQGSSIAYLQRALSAI